MQAPPLLLAWVLAALSAPAPFRAGAQQNANRSDTIAIVRAVIDHLRAAFPRDSVVVDPHLASGTRLPVDSFVASIGARLGAEEDIVPCQRQSPDTCHLEAHLLVRVDSMLVGQTTAEVVVHFWTGGTSALMPVAQKWRKFFVKRRGREWEYSRASRRVQITERVPMRPTSELLVTERLPLSPSESTCRLYSQPRSWQSI